MADRAPDLHNTLTRIRVRGYKSLVDVDVAIRPLTILAGANSSGKSSLMQPLLLIKQSLEAPFSTGDTLLLDGPNVHLASADDALSRIASPRPGGFSFKVEVGSSSCNLHYQTNETRQLRLTGMDLSYPGTSELIEISSTSRGEKIGAAVARLAGESHNELSRIAETGGLARVSPSGIDFEIERDGKYIGANRFYGPSVSWITREAIHLPGLRGVPQRAYPTAANRSSRQGTFEPYTASIIRNWQETGDKRLGQLARDLRHLGLTRSVEARVKSPTETELLVGRLPVGGRGADDLVNVADVGFGVSQTLPVVVALLAAAPGQTVYIEQPELHLHPRAQRAMATLLAAAARRGARVVIETHSSILLLAVQTLVAEGKLAPDLVALHWFKRDSKGATKVTTADLDADGTFGTWPEDFSDVEIAAEGAYLDAVGRRRAR